MHPHLFQFGRLVLPTYGFLVALGTIASLLLLVRTARLLSLNTDNIWSVALLAIVTALVANSILLVLFHWPRYGLGAGLVQAAIATIVGVLYARRLGLPVLRTADAFAPSLALGSAVAAVGCLEAGCNFGTPARVPWAVIFNDPAAAPGNTPWSAFASHSALYQPAAVSPVYLPAVVAASRPLRRRNSGCVALPERSFQLPADILSR